MHGVRARHDQTSGSAMASANEAGYFTPQLRGYDAHNSLATTFSVGAGKKFVPSPRPFSDLAKAENRSGVIG
jgi:hypothetical protein